MAEVAVKTPVTMEDGRVVEFSTKQKLNKTSTIEDGVVSTRFDFRNGAVRTFTVPPELLLRFAAHGVEQKLGDSIAGESDVDDAVASMDDLIARLNAGEWTIKRAAGEFAGTSILMKALIEVSGKPAEAIKAYLSTKTAGEKLALRRSAQLRPTIERLEAEKASKSKNVVDTDSLLAELGDLGAGATDSAKKSK